MIQQIKPQKEKGVFSYSLFLIMMKLLKSKSNSLKHPLTNYFMIIFDEELKMSLNS
jgi:hypothetical protein